MGSYLIIPKETPREKLHNWFNKHKPFYNDFGEKLKFSDIFGDLLNPKGDIRFKYGVNSDEGFKHFYCPVALREIEKIEGVKQE